MSRPTEKDYFIRVFWSAEDECYVAEVPELKGCSGLGESVEEAIREAHRSIRGWLDVARKNRMPIPKPSIRTHVGRLNLRLPSDVIRRIKMAAAEQDMSLNQYVMKVLLSSA